MTFTRPRTFTRSRPAPRSVSGGPAIEVRGLRMRYGPVEVVRGIDLEVARGEIFAFLGPNGAGKTTTVEILEGFRTRTAGDVRVFGVDPVDAGSDWRDRVGVVLQSSAPEPELTVQETIDLYAGFYPHPLTAAHVLDLTGLAGQADTRNRRLSGGQQRRLDLALALVGDPDLLFLDEPTTGFDPAARRATWEVIAGLKGLGKTLFLTTHYLEEAEVLADRIAVILDGRILAEGTPSDLGGRRTRPSIISFRLPAPGGRSVGLPPNLAGHPVATPGGRVTLESLDPTGDLGRLTAWATTISAPLEDLEVRRPSLEDIYLDLTTSGGRS